MHHFIFCQKDTFIYSEETARRRNFGLDGYVEIGCVNKLSRTFRTASQSSTVLSSELINRYVQNFNGSFSGSIYCATGSVSGSVNCDGATSPGGICAPLGIVDEFGNIIMEDDGDPAYISVDEDFFVFP
jgi:hypothetical protein